MSNNRGKFIDSIGKLVGINRDSEEENKDTSDNYSESLFPGKSSTVSTVEDESYLSSESVLTKRETDSKTNVYKKETNSGEYNIFTNNPQLTTMVFTPNDKSASNDTESMIKAMREGSSVILNLNDQMDRIVKLKVLNRCIGACYALEGRAGMINDTTYYFYPKNVVAVQVRGDHEKVVEDKDISESIEENYKVTWERNEHH